MFVTVQLLYLKTLMTPPKKILDLLSTFSIVAGYKSNIQKSVPFLYTNNKQAENKIRETIPFTISLRI
jgi:hypothetical protein